MQVNVFPRVGKAHPSEQPPEYFWEALSGGTGEFREKINQGKWRDSE